MNKPQLQLPINNLAPKITPSAAWRPIHYLGSKLRLIEPLCMALDHADPNQGPVCDLFAGSGTVAAALASTRDVIAVDIQEYSRVLCSAILNPAPDANFDVRKFAEQALGANHRRRVDIAFPLIEYETECLQNARRGNAEAICELIENASIVMFYGETSPRVDAAFTKAQKKVVREFELCGLEKSPSTLMLRYFGGLYFSYLQAVQLDSLLLAAHEQTGALRDCLLATIISTASEVVNTVGKHFAQPIKPRGSDGKPKQHLVGKILRDRELDVPSIFLSWFEKYRSLPLTHRDHQIIRADYGDALAGLKKKIGVVYADPPYTRDHYSRFYHVLETMCLWDNPEVSTTRIRSEELKFSRGMYRTERHQSPFCIKSQAPRAFDRLFSAVRNLDAPLVLSYSPFASETNARPRVLTVDQILELAKKHFDRVEVASAGNFSHMKLNASKFNAEPTNNAELIFTCS